MLNTPTGVEAALRRNESGDFLFLLNHNADTALTTLDRDGEELLTGRKLRAGECLELKAKGVAIVKC